jgi:hypothetical protein
MKVVIGPYKNWIGPYQIAEWVPFLNEDRQDRLGEWLAQTWVAKVCNWIHKLRGERNIKVRIDPYDTWSMDHTLAHIILPMLKQLRDTKHGSAYVDDEDLPQHMRYTSKKSEDDWETEDHWVHYKWEWVLNEMIWAFEQELDENWEDQFSHGVPDIEWEIVSGSEEDDSACYRVNLKNPYYWVDYEGIKRYNERIQNGFRLFGKYYQNLWD